MGWLRVYVVVCLHVMGSVCVWLWWWGWGWGRWWLNQNSGGDSLIAVVVMVVDSVVVVMVVESVVVVMVIVEVTLRGEGECGKEVLGQVWITC